MSIRDIVHSRTGAVVAGVTVLVTLGGVGGAVAANTIDSRDIRNGTVRSIDVANGTLGMRDMNDYTKGRINRESARNQGEPGKDGADGIDGKDGAAGKDGAPGAPGSNGSNGANGKDGVSNLIVGAAYTDKWAPHSFGESIEECPAGQYALGGGYSQWGGYDTNGGYDLGGTNRNIEVTVSAPFFKGEYVPVDEAGNFRADQWVVRGYNDGDTEQIVRAWVVCADITD